MKKISAARNIYRAYMREWRIDQRHETGYDPENGTYVNLRNDGRIVRIPRPPVAVNTDADFWRDMDIRRQADRVAYGIRCVHDPLPSQFGTVIEAINARDAHNTEDVMAVFGPTTSAEVYRSVRARTPWLPLPPSEDLLKLSNTEIERLISAWIAMEWPGDKNYGALVLAAKAELSRRIDIQAPCVDVYTDLMDSSMATAKQS